MARSPARIPRMVGLQRAATRRLQHLRQRSVLAVAVTALMLLLVDAEAGDAGDSAAVAPPAAPDEIIADASLALEQATSTARDLALSLYGMLPRIAIALLLLISAWLVGRLVQVVLRRTLSGWHRTEAMAALARIGLYLLAAAGGLAILAGDARALLGSVGLVGLALSWALQTPIESFTGWLLNSFRGYYRVGDRIEVGEVFGDVYRIDVLTTTVWEAGGPGKPVAGAQPTGAMITFPNWEVLRSNIINYSRDFPFVWDEIAFSITNESDAAHAATVIEGVARSLIGPRMEEPVRHYQGLLDQARLAFDVEELPCVFLSQADAWTVATLRYLVPVRQRRRWASELLLAVNRELAAAEHAGRIVSAYPRQEVRLLDDWRPATAGRSPGPRRDPGRPIKPA